MPDPDFWKSATRSPSAVPCVHAREEIERLYQEKARLLQRVMDAQAALGGKK